jgi:hypothetical protein
MLIARNWRKKCFALVSNVNIGREFLLVLKFVDSGVVSVLGHYDILEVGCLFFQVRTEWKGHAYSVMKVSFFRFMDDNFILWALQSRFLLILSPLS